jgi:uncharacterized protein YuzE
MLAEKPYEPFIRLLPSLKSVLGHAVYISYDEEADVLYVSLGEPRAADDTDMTDEGILTRYADGEIVGYTILNASKQAVAG